ncbi:MULTISPECIES: glycoside hydrolase family 88 protein [unclassified Imperialibacter]|uniref:glycoside hydrolase family 88 protein n=1 Tax=unclassified Imperialibacter TaxID=2629706 RepID=UPI00125A39F7|nr:MULTISPECIES: glycoside hydrolase family 88 protein [unclassified Imperialibacter]CAD5281419.1 Glycosyl Hydrolase Family 88 [Imperialibacter sp. 89]CAD5288171.1 Glycosyl Hydrolase Family 88 [Imperialibacter sp. 75]VVT31247.1 Glycosyl Hydrolase Family 88 [Imperialibacter sp. EC-SDR9]
MKIDNQLKVEHLEKSLNQFWDLSGQKILAIEKQYDGQAGTPVFTVEGKYTTRGWTEWTQGFQFGSALLQYDATGEKEFLQIGRKNTVEKMAPHLTHKGVHDHGFNNISTYGNLLRLMHEGKTEHNEWEKNFYELAIKVSGAVQAMRWTTTKNGGYIYSFNGPHSLFVDTVRSCRILMMSHVMGHSLMGENDEKISLLKRTVRHLISTANYSVFYGEGRDLYDLWGRTAHESIFNTNDGNFRSVSTQQGYTGMSTWTRGLAWAMCGFPEELEFFEKVPESALEGVISKKDLMALMLKAAKATCDFYIENSCTDGIPYWDTGAPGLVHMGDYLSQPSDPFNAHEPVDSSAAAIGAQGLLRLGKYLNEPKYTQAGLTAAKALFSEPYLSTDPAHQGLTLHSVYHRPNDWDHVPAGQKVPCGESSMWGDYHARELALYLTKQLKGEEYYTFFNGLMA